jgi:hypothetical protein
MVRVGYFVLVSSHYKLLLRNRLHHYSFASAFLWSVKFQYQDLLHHLSKKACASRIGQKLQTHTFQIELQLQFYLSKSLFDCNCKLARFLRLLFQVEHKKFNASKGQRKADKIYHVQNVNNMDKRLRAFMQPFNGVATKYLQNYLHWFLVLEKIKHSTKRMATVT